MKIFGLFILLFFGSMFFDTHVDIYSIHFTTIDNEDKSLEEFSGKKIMIVILPVTRTPGDSAFLRSLVRASETYGDKISVIGIPSFEDGYSEADSNNLAYYYRMTMGRTIIISKAMYTRKTSRDKQHSFFSWLTHAEQNGHFAYDAAGAREKFFINERGELYGIVSAKGELDNELMDRMVNN
jgi:glutathione peroxidase-family protein